VESRQLSLTRFLSALAIRQLFRGSTILLNQTGVQGGQAREVPHSVRAGDGVVVAQDDGDRAPLGVHPIHGPEAARQRVLLAGALALEPRDLASEQLDVALGLLDPLLQARGLPLLGRQTAFVFLELGEQRRLASAGRRRPFLLLLELLLRLLELALLRLQRILALRLR